MTLDSSQQAHLDSVLDSLKVAMRERDELRAEVERRVDHHAYYHAFCSMGRGDTPCPHEAENEHMAGAAY